MWSITTKPTGRSAKAAAALLGSTAIEVKEKEQQLNMQIIYASQYLPFPKVTTAS
ncbi:hypothetical protein EVA_09479 [gut metagenome]|uniref:Uncharacterized protein n=1 Tax=gut metagenome TaxID=749906 RepID=J9CQJ6_9ZZZZ